MQNHRIDLYLGSPEFLLYHWSGKTIDFGSNKVEAAAIKTLNQ